MQPEIYEWFNKVCSSYNHSTNEYGIRLNNSQVLYITLCYFFLSDEQGLHQADMFGEKALEGVLSATKTKVKLITVNPELKYLAIEFPYNVYNTERDEMYRLHLAGLIKNKGLWDFCNYVDSSSETPQLGKLKNEYPSLQSLMEDYNNLNILWGTKVADWESFLSNDGDYGSTISLAQELHEYYSLVGAHAQKYEECILDGLQEGEEGSAETYQYQCAVGLIMNHFAYYLKRINLVLDDEKEFNLEC